MDHTAMQHGSYKRLALMTVLSFISMYILMYAMVNVFSNVVPSYNQFYMAGLMTAPMIVIELLVMGVMYNNKKLNAVLVALSALVGILFFVMIRQQTFIGDKQFIKSMIPHHSGAILMCGKAKLKDPELKQLCANIVKGQQQEIDEMKGILNRLQ
ncbi:MAG: DUF305 domain-containing protein [Bacteroidetes bacterium]|nr:DUF305 domain-containing protein [Bacteroidota bacterium]